MSVLRDTVACLLSLLLVIVGTVISSIRIGGQVPTFQQPAKMKGEFCKNKRGPARLTRSPSGSLRLALLALARDIACGLGAKYTKFRRVRPAELLG